jgi:hypothetical protein
MEMPLDTVAEGGAREKREGGARERAWSRLPHAVVRDGRLDDKGLVTIAIRSTYADDASDFGLSAVILKRAVRAGFGRDVAERTIKAMQTLGCLDRHQPPPRVRGRQVLCAVSR